ncbi:addiction module toxin RelE (plasmid) [Methylobacterium sp. XJLW]|uniref:type II toxin-antitoxin system RelE/ParE family toxin n=1 Tax=Methylobacterium sp. XJLW TaxID=739141 RepID=UPI000DAAF08B|nr:type II toxin-antitoxin system RelE/ParE family toxin [Methylobacterium sp. XJLW]AWV19857.1 addiction module toxin RelE [Methylobacterium sp. XJLW]
MHGIVELPLYLADAKSAGVTDEDRDMIAAVIAADPEAGDLIPGTGGARKVRIAGKGKGKSGGYRVITYYAAADVPVFLLRLVSKGQRADISKAERNDVRLALATIVEDYREDMRRKVRTLRTT